MRIAMDQEPLSCSLARKPAARFIGVSDRRFAELLATDPDFPKAVELGGPRSSRWIRSELLEYVASRPRVQRQEPPALAAARAAKVAGLPPAPGPFDGVSHVCR
jgi:predicted DNA-binding transcriptional regulator AlpA